MKPEAKQLRDRVAELRKELSGAEKDLGDIVQSCQHQYGPTIYDPIYTKAYTIPGDVPGTMGVDWRGPVDVPAHTEKRWKRDCGLCGEEEYTTRVNQEVKETPHWPEHRR